ncbi:hypothetical protein SAMN04515674_102278 [Pseudarcicella hirudinis]|uniref:HNH endonuclease n=1 Tax=Pseudarcicella hirudinis TaxID=1079859 RepID=A0A1I5P4L7_9BACT|nr:hypothetical protein [Pseudarcicella hirudinis]SFP28999.1 hypothetical protein SAMN04515674_102278 [Pseudarcicella hirudinis]
MIKIDTPNLEQIANEYLDKIKEKCLLRITILHLTLKVLFDNYPTTDLDALLKNNSTSLNYKTFNSYINFFLLPNNKLKNVRSYTKVTVANCHLWVRQNNDVLKKICSFLSSEKNLKDLILTSPNELYKKHRYFYRKLKIDKENKNIRSFIENAIDFNQVNEYAYWLTSSINVNTCPYCNRVPINTVWGKNKIIRPALDHFYPQSKYPLLALSFYNLIPSCSYCNSNLKGNVQITSKSHLSPYVEGFEDKAVFKSKITEINKYRIYFESTIGSKDKRIFGKKRLKKDEKNSCKTGNINLFKLEEIYNACHQDIVNELLFKCERYSDEYRKSISNTFPILKDEKYEFYQFYFGNYLDPKNFNKRPLAKLTRDIVVKELPYFANRPGI